MKVGRSVGGGVCRAAGAVARGARRILSALPLLGIAPPEYDDDTENYDEKDTTVRQNDTVYFSRHASSHKCLSSFGVCLLRNNYISKKFAVKPPIFILLANNFLPEEFHFSFLRILLCNISPPG